MEEEKYLFELTYLEFGSLILFIYLFFFQGKNSIANGNYLSSHKVMCFWHQSKITVMLL